MMGACDPTTTTEPNGEPTNPDTTSTPDEPKTPDELIAAKRFLSICPGATGCEDNNGDLEVGVSNKAITPTAYEVSRYTYMKEEGSCPSPVKPLANGIWRCGQLMDQAQYNRKDCGLDGICPRDKNTPIKTRISCQDTPCPGDLICKDEDKRCYVTYTAPDADGSEGDGLPDWFVDCGRDRVCPCLGPDKVGSYHGKDKKCLIGHTANPDYTGPDKDGSEGNRIFEGVWMAGFNGNHPMMGKNDDIWARAMVFRTGKTTVAIVSLDLVGYFNNQIQKIRKGIQEQLKDKADVDYVLVSSTHGHEGPDTMGLWGRHEAGVPAESGMNLEYIDFINKTTAAAVLEAYNKLQPVRMFAAKTNTGAAGFVRDSRDPVVIDDSMNVLQFLPKNSDTPIVTLINWGNHPETLSDYNNFVTSDFPHYLREAIEKGIAPKGSFKGLKAVGGTAFYLQAAVGGLMTQLRIPVTDVDGTVQNKSDWDKARALGHQLALKAVQALEKKEEIKGGISLWAKEVFLTMENRYYHIGFNLNLFNREGVNFDPDQPINKANLPQVRSEVALIRIGDVTLYSMPGELDPQVLIGGYDGAYKFEYDLVDPNNKNPPDLTKAPKGPYLKERIPGKYKLFVGLGNDQLGYILPNWNWQLSQSNPYLEQAEGDHYEETNSVGPQTLPLLLQAYDAILQMADATPPK